MTDADDTAANEPAAAPESASPQPDTLLGWPLSEDLSQIIYDEDVYPNLYERRIPECGAPWPDGLGDPLSRDLVDTARWFLFFLVNTFWSPASLARLEWVWQWRKFDFLDCLRPIELLLRRLLLIEALGLILSQALPPVRAGADGEEARFRFAPETGLRRRLSRNLARLLHLRSGAGYGWVASATPQAPADQSGSGQMPPDHAAPLPAGVAPGRPARPPAGGGDPRDARSGQVCAAARFPAATPS